MGSSQRMFLPEVFGEELMNQIVRRILHHLDLFEHHLLFALDIVRGECGAPDDVGEDIERHRQVLVENLDVVAGVLLGGKGIHLTADGVDFLRDVLRRPRRCALEQHVFDEMGNAGPFAPVRDASLGSATRQR